MCHGVVRPVQASHIWIFLINNVIGFLQYHRHRCLRLNAMQWHGAAAWWSKYLWSQCTAQFHGSIYIHRHRTPIYQCERARARYKNSHFWCVVVNESLFISLQFRSRVRLAFNPLIIVGRVHSACICGAVAYFPLESLHYFPIFALVPIILLHYKYKINFFYTSIYICIAGCSGLLHHTGQPKWKQQQHRRWKWTTLWTWENA